MKIASLFVFFAALLVLPAALFSQGREQTLAARFDPLIRRGMQEDPLPGFAIGIVKDGKLAYARGFGVMTLGRADKPVTPDTLFHMASVTKPFVATAVMQLWEQGKVDLDAPVTKYLPYFHLADDRYRRITVRQMLTHTSGMPDVTDYRWDKPEYDDGALERYVRSLGEQKLLWDPGAHMSYSNMAYEVLGDLIAKVSGVSFEDYVQASILEPLGMKSSTLLLKKADSARLADGYTRPRDGDFASIHAVAAYPYNRAHSPSSDLHSDVVDMARWAMANLNRGELDGKRILKPSTYDVMWKPAAEVEICRGPEHLDCTRMGDHVGISWFLGSKNGQQVVYHSGGDDGFLTLVALVPQRMMALVFMQNSLHAGSTLGKSVKDEFFHIASEAGSN